VIAGFPNSVAMGANASTISRVNLFPALDGRSHRTNWQPEAMTDWTIANIPPQAGKLAVVTGATGGLGYQTAMRLAQAGAEVVLTGRNEPKGAKRSRKSATSSLMPTSDSKRSTWQILPP